MTLFLVCFIAGASCLLSFLLFFHPLQQNVVANRWLGFFVFIIGCAFTSIYMLNTELARSNNFLFKSLTSLQFLLAPSLYISTLYFVKPIKAIRKIDWLHFLPFLIYASAEIIWKFGKETISLFPLFVINKEVSFLVRDILPFLLLFYLIKSYKILARHKTNLKLISSSTSQINLDWLTQFLFILLITVIIWINDALFELPFLTAATVYIYTICIFFLAYFSIKQKTIFAFREQDIKQIADILDNKEYKKEVSENPGLVETEATTGAKVSISGAVPKEKLKTKRLSPEELALLSAQLTSLMENDQLFLENDLNLATVAERLAINIHETSFLINETSGDNFFNFINKYRVEEAKRLLVSAKMEELNILGIAFASGFNSKTTFNTTFKKITGVSPTQYCREQKK